jgi:protein-S-isoprenylcysteine O-methyltransferase Ste14
MNIFFTATYCTWFLMEFLLTRLLHSKSTDKKNTDKNSLSLLWVIIVATITIAVFISMRFYSPIFRDPQWRYLGLIVIIIGIIIRFIAIISLGKFFTVDVTIRQNHRLKKDGLYKYLRHPSYFASLVSFAGFGISLNNCLGLGLSVVAITAAFIIRIRIEEKILVEQFGFEYLDYMRCTKGIIPFVY